MLQVDVNQIALARKEQAAWAGLTIAERARRLRALRHRIAEEARNIVEVIAEETGKTPLDALSGDVLMTLEQLLYNEVYAERVLKARRIAKPALFFLGAQFEEVREPYGVVLIYAPSNYPFQLSVIPMTTALIAGNAAVVKCSEKTPRMAQLVEGLLRGAEVPDGLVQVVSSAPESAGSLIDAGPDLVFFTGSSENGRKVAMRAAEHLIPTVLELGGKDPCLVFGDCNFERAVEGVAFGAFANAGQVCVGIKLLYVEESIFPSFVDALSGRAEKLRVGSAKDSDLGVLPPGAGRERFVAQVEEAIRRGAHLHLPRNGALRGEEPVILSEVPAGARLITEEVFGPVVCAAPFRDEAEAVALGNASPFALSSSVWTGDAARGRRIAAQMTAGSCAVNDVVRNIANPHGSFGGNRRSGYGRYHGPEGLMAFSRTKSVMTLHDRRKHELHWFPATSRTFRLLEKVVAFRHGRGSLLGRIRRLWPVLLIFLLGGVGAAAQGGAQLHIVVMLAPGSHGEVAYLVFNSKNGFPNTKSKALRGGFVQVPDAQAHEVKIDAGTLPPGRYAVTVYQDLNGNKKLDKNLMGIPQEPAGASNNPRTRMGPPSFEECAFQFGTTDQTISIVLRRG